MKKIYEKIASSLYRRPFKSLFVSVLVIVGMFAGASQMRMATGNDTLVQTDNPVYLSNLRLEESFGGESILVLVESDSSANLLSVENIDALYQMQLEIESIDEVFSILSVPTLLNEMTSRQKDAIVENVEKLSSGLGEMSNKMIELGETLKAKDIKDPSEMLEKLNGLVALSDKFNSLEAGQRSLSAGVYQMELGLAQSASGIASVSSQLSTLANSSTSGVLQQQLLSIASNLSKSATGLQTLSTNTQSVQSGANQTADALDQIEKNLSAELSTMKADLSSAMTKAELMAMADGFIEMGAKLKDISEALATFESKSGMLIPYLPNSQEEMDLLLYEENELRSVFNELILTDTQSLMVIKLEGNLSDPVKDEVTSKIQSIFEENESDTLDITVSGKTVLDSALKSEMKNSMQFMIVLAIGIMFVILMLVFKVKWRLLSLGVIFIAVLATLGFMSWLNVPVTMVSMAVFPILIGLGIDYSIQFHNRFNEDYDFISSIKNITGPVAVAVLATMLGFLSLYASPVPMIQDFGKMLTIGVVISFLAALFILMPILRLGQMHEFKEKKFLQNTQKGFLEKTFRWISKTSIRFGLIILLSVSALAAYGFYVDPLIEVETDIEVFMPQDLEALEDLHKIRDLLDSTDQIAIVTEDESMLSLENLQAIEALEKNLESKYSNKIFNVQSIVSLMRNMDEDLDLSQSTSIEGIKDIPENQRQLFVTEDESQALILLEIDHLSTSDLQTLIRDLELELKVLPFNTVITGKSVLDVEMVEGLTSGRVSMTLYGLGLVFVALLLIYRNLFKAIIPIIPVIIIIGVSSWFMYTYHIAFTPITATLGALVLGMGTEMTVMVMERFIEERELGLNKNEAMQASLESIGKAVLASGLTTVGGFSVLLFSDFVILKDFGVMTVVNISLALASTFVVLPPLVVMLDRWIVKKEKGELKC